MQNEHDTIGVLKLKVCSATLKRDVEMFGKQDPFAELEISGFSIKKTSVMDDAG